MIDDVRAFIYGLVAEEFELDNLQIIWENVDGSSIPGQPYLKLMVQFGDMADIGISNSNIQAGLLVASIHYPFNSGVAPGIKILDRLRKLFNKLMVGSPELEFFNATGPQYLPDADHYAQRLLIAFRYYEQSAKQFA